MAENTEIVQAQQGEDEIQPFQIIHENSLGAFDGQRFYLQRFPVWNQTKKAMSGVDMQKFCPEEGTVNGVTFWQSMGMMHLRYPLDADVTETDLDVQLSSWEMKVTLNNTKKSIGPLSGELGHDIRVKLSHWEIVDDPMAGRMLTITLCKKAHKAWKSLWFSDVFNPHKRRVFAWNQALDTKNVKDPEDEKLKSITAGTQELMKELVMTQDSSRLCTGILETEEDQTHISLYLWLDEEALENACLALPIEEIFAADIEENYVEVYVRADGSGVCWGQLVGGVVPELTHWEIIKNMRREVPKNSGIRCPAYYSPALLIKFTKTVTSQYEWGKVFQDVQHADFEPPKERMSWTERLQRSMVLAPAGFMDGHVKADRAKTLIKEWEAKQDERFVYIDFEIEARVFVAATTFKVDLSGFFSLNVGTEFMEIKVLADMEYGAIIGKLSGIVLPELASWEIAQKDGKLMLVVTMMKCPGANGDWEEPIFQKMNAWELTQLFIDNGELDPAVAESQEGEGQE